MEAAAVVVQRPPVARHAALARAQRAKVLGCPRRHVCAQQQLEPPRRHAADAHVEIDQRVGTCNDIPPHDAAMRRVDRVSNVLLPVAPTAASSRALCAARCELSTLPMRAGWAGRQRRFESGRLYLGLARGAAADEEQRALDARAPLLAQHSMLCYAVLCYARRYYAMLCDAPRRCRASRAPAGRRRRSKRSPWHRIAEHAMPLPCHAMVCYPGRSPPRPPARPAAR